MSATPSGDPGCGGPTPPRTAALTALGPDGRARWRRDLASPDAGDAQTPPLVDDTSVYTAVGGDVTAISRSDGTVRWRQPAPGPAYGLWRDGSRIVVSVAQVGTEGAVLAFDATSGDPVWRYDESGRGLLGDQLPTGDGGLAMVSAAGDTQVLDLASGTLRWSAAGRAQDYGLGVADGVVLRAVGGRLAAHDARSGRVRWHMQGVPSPAVLRSTVGVVVVWAGAVGPSVSGAVQGLDAATGRRLWRIAENEPLAWGGSGQSGQLLYREQSGHPQAMLVDTATGRVRWRADTQIAMYLPGLVGSDTVTTLEGGTSLQRDTTLVVRDAVTGKVTASTTLTRTTSTAPVALTGGRTGVITFRDGRKSTVTSYYHGSEVWSAELDSAARWVVPAGADAIAFTNDPAYGCAMSSRR